MTSILVVDDSAVDRRLVGELLERKFECSVQYAVNGVEAWRDSRICRQTLWSPT